MEVFIIMEFIFCDDRFYGYNEHLHSIYGSFEEAKTMVDTLLVRNKEWAEWIEEDHTNFIRIIRMEIGNTKQEILFDSMNMAVDIMDGHMDNIL